MEILRITHDDFVLTFECQNWQRMWEKGKSLLGGAHHLSSTYTWSQPCVVERLDETERHRGELTHSKPTEAAFFFEQTDYSVWCEFKTDVQHAEVISNRQDDKDRFSYKAQKKILMGFINYENEIGRSDFHLKYTVGKEEKHFIFSYDVLSAKLDYHHDWKIILQDIENEYRMLSLDYLRKTYHGIAEGDGESFDLIWWNIFHGLQDEFIRATKNIIERPRHRLRAVSSYKRADQIRLFTPTLEQQFAEHRKEEQHLYFVEEQQTTHNTVENRFLKHTLQMVEKRYAALAKRILDELALKISDNEKERIRVTADELQHLVRNPFFRTVSKFEGLRQESLVLQRDVNYSKIYRTAAILQKSFSLNEGMYRMETKDIATLYEIWCFIQVEKVVKQLFGETGKPDVVAEHRSRQEMHGLFTRELSTGQRSHIVFKQGDVTLAELYYNPRHDSHEEGIRGINNLQSLTVVQKPDIVLQLTKDDIQRGMNLTYLFDAKYRIEESNGREVPPDDAINQMHRYRDAIYYSQPHDGLRKEVLGGYILFPGKMDKSNPLYKSVEQVNIGAFPLRPGDQEFNMLRDFIRDLMLHNAIDLVEQTIPQKGTTLEVHDKVLVGVVKKDNVAKFKNQTATRYYSGVKFPKNIPLDDIHWFAPYLEGEGVRDLYRVTSIHTGDKDPNNPEDNLRIILDLQFDRQLFNTPKRYTDNPGWEMQTFLYSKISEL